MLQDFGARLLEPSGVQDPYSVYAEMRPAAPVVWSDVLGMWLVSTHQLCREAYRSWEALSSVGINVSGRLDKLPEDVRAVVSTVEAVEGAQVLNVADPPVHTRHRAFFNRPLSARRLAAHQGWIEAYCDQFADELGSEESVDLIEDFSTPLAYAIILQLFGSPLEHVPVYQRAADAFFGYHSVGGASATATLRYEAALVELRQTLQGLYEEMRKSEPDATVISSLLHPVGDAAPPDDLELFVLLRKFFAGGHENLIYTIAVAVLELLRHPDQLAMVRSDPTKAKDAYEEAIRWEPPNQGNPRIAVADDPLKVGSIAAGDSVMILKAAAARDPAAWSNPNSFDIRRDQNEPPGGSIAFGQGPHFCVGAGLARAVGPAAINALVTRYPSMRLVDGWEPHWGDTPLRRRLTSLPLVLY